MLKLYSEKYINFTVLRKENIVKRLILAFLVLFCMELAADSNQTKENWDKISPLIYESQNSLRDIKVINKDDFLKIRVDANKTQTHTGIYLDIDNDENTGFYSDLWDHSGMDYLIEDGRIYKSLGREWAWEYIGKAWYSKNENSFEVTIDKSILDNVSDKFKIGVTHSNKDWKIVSKIPSSKRVAKFPRIIKKGDGFDKIRELILKASNFEYDDVVYICVGDSTRADDWYYNNGHVFKIVKSALIQYNVKAYLEATPGYTAKEYARGYYFPSWKDTVSLIKGDGSHAIVDISLGINDARYYGGEGKAAYIKAYLKDAINKILKYKPKTNFMLTMPNSMIGFDNLVKEYKKAYLELSKEMNIHLVNKIDEIFANDPNDFLLFRDLDAYDYGANKRIHLSILGQRKVADLILSYILPDN